MPKITLRKLNSFGRLSGDQKYIGFAFGKFQNRKPDRNEAGQLECLNWMINHSRLENESVEDLLHPLHY
jgi:hypothetical protein